MAGSLFNSAKLAHSLDSVNRQAMGAPSEPHQKLLLIVDDEPFQHRLLELATELDLDTRRETAAADAILAYRTNWVPHAIVIDQLMPRSEYYAAIRALRSAFGVPVLAITGETGSRDHLPEPGVLLLGREAAMAEIQRLTRPAGAGGSVLSIGPLTLDRNSCTAAINGNPLRLTPDEATTLAMLMEHEGSVVHRRTLVAALGGLQRDLDPRIIDVHVVRLMVRLGSSTPILIERSQDREGYLLRRITVIGAETARSA